MAVTHKYSIVCDEVRREDNGKLLIIGMYSNSVIIVPSFPAVLPSLTILSVFEGNRPESMPFRLEIRRLENNQKAAEAQGFANIQQPGEGLMPVRFSPMVFQESGSYTAQLEMGGELIPIASLQVMLPPAQSMQFGTTNPFSKR